MENFENNFNLSKKSLKISGVSLIKKYIEKN